MGVRECTARKVCVYIMPLYAILSTIAPHHARLTIKNLARVRRSQLLFLQSDSQICNLAGSSHVGIILREAQKCRAVLLSERMGADGSGCAGDRGSKIK